MYVYYDDRSVTFETEEKEAAKDFLLDELTRWDSDFFKETLNDLFSASDIFDMLVNETFTENIRDKCNDIVYDAAINEIEDNFNQYFDEIIEDEEG